MADSNKKYAPYLLLVMVATLAVAMWKSGNEPEITPVVMTPQGPVQGVGHGCGVRQFQRLAISPRRL